VKFKLYFGNDTEYEGEGDAAAFAVPADASTNGVQKCKQECDNDRGYTVRGGNKWLVWERITRSGGLQLKEGRWGGKSDDVGLIHYLFTHQGPQKILVGIEIDDELYAHIGRKVISDGCFCDVPCKHIIPHVGRI